MLQLLLDMSMDIFWIYGVWVYSSRICAQGGACLGVSGGTRVALSLSVAIFVSLNSVVSALAICDRAPMFRGMVLASANQDS